MPPRPRMFIASSQSQIALARAVQEELEADVEATIWNQGVFQLSQSTIAELIYTLEDMDFGAFVFAPDDVARMGEIDTRVVRDNVVFEMGMFVGRLGVERCFMIAPRASNSFHLPSDLAGLTRADFDADRQDRNLLAALGPGCNRIRRAIQKLGIFNRVMVSKVDEPSSPDTSLFSDPRDCFVLITSWLGNRPAGDNTKAIVLADVDRELRLVRGSAAKYLAGAAATWGYQVASKGERTVLLTSQSMPY